MLCYAFWLSMNMHRFFSVFGSPFLRIVFALRSNVWCEKCQWLYISLGSDNNRNVTNANWRFISHTRNRTISYLHDAKRLPNLRSQMCVWLNAFLLSKQRRNYGFIRAFDVFRIQNIRLAACRIVSRPLSFTIHQQSYLWAGSGSCVLFAPFGPNRMYVSNCSSFD